MNSINDYLPELTDFFSHIGVGIQKPYAFDKGDTTDLCYYAFGKAVPEKGHEYEIDFYGENKFVSVVLVKGDTENERFVVELFGVSLENP